MSVQYETEVWQNFWFPMHWLTIRPGPDQLPEVTKQFKELQGGSKEASQWWEFFHQSFHWSQADTVTQGTRH